jgi:sterol desaturase/sphingolipid hydroxylase (fatty acid hydroxylase superfamily)
MDLPTPVEHPLPPPTPEPPRDTFSMAVGAYNGILSKARLQLEAAPAWVTATAETALWPGVMASALIAADIQFHQGIHESLIASSVLFGSLATVATAERLIPIRPEDNERDPNDIKLNLTNIVFSETAFPLLTFMPLANFGENSSEGLNLWSHLPHKQITEWLTTNGILADASASLIEHSLDFGAALLIAEFANYWSHRLTHIVPDFWPIHFIHHTPEYLTATAAGRSHPLNIWTAFAGAAVLKFLNVPVETIMLTLVTSSAMAFLQHANARMRLGFLSKIFISPEAHRLHHSRDPKHFDKNFGMVITVWDHVFGTYMEDNTLATGTLEPSPRTYFEQLAHPFKKWATAFGL